MQAVTDKIVYIMGGSSGIGLATAKLLFEQGAAVTIFSRDTARLARAAGEIAGQADAGGGKVSWMQLDVADRSAVKRVLRTAVERHGVPDILMNCAGRAYPRCFENVSFDQFNETMQINLYGVWHVTRQLVPLMKARGGHVVNVASVAGFVGLFGYTDYCASKFAVMGFSEALRSELKPYGILVSVLCPADTDTPALEVENRTKPQETRAISENAGLLQPDDVARALLKGLMRKQAVIVPGTEGKMTWLAKRWLPGLVERIMDRTIRKVQAESSSRRQKG